MGVLVVLAVLAAGYGLAGPRAPGFAPGSPPKDFRGLAFGASVKELADLIPVAGQDPGKAAAAYFRKNEPRTFGAAAIVSVAYYFKNDRLYGVGVAFQGQANYFSIREELERVYGKGRSAAGRYGWMWPSFSLELRFDTDRLQGEIRYTQEAEPPKEGERPPLEPRPLPEIPRR